MIYPCYRIKYNITKQISSCQVQSVTIFWSELQKHRSVSDERILRTTFYYKIMKFYSRKSNQKSRSSELKMYIFVSA